MLNKVDVRNIIDDSLEGIKPEKLVKNACSFENDILKINAHEIFVPKDKKIHVFASGKASLSMINSMYEILDEKIEKMLAVGPYENSLEIPNLEYIKSTHPLPSIKSIDAAMKISNSLSDLKEDDIFIYLLSGGNSALVELPVYDIGLEEFQETTNLMIKGSMPIEKINCVRKHLSLVKGGRMGSFTIARGYILVLSDVLGNSFEDIGSAPFYSDKTTFDDAVDYLKEYKLFDNLPQSVQSYLIKGVNKDVRDTLKKELVNIKHFLIGSNEIFLESIQKQFKKKEIDSEIFYNAISDDVEDVCKEFINFCNDGKKGCFIFGGEATVLVKGNGKGGRNQHLVLKFLESFPKDKEVIFLSVASDGIDGASDAAGAIIDNNSIEDMKKINLDINTYLDNFDSNSFFEKLNSTIKPGPTHNNMLDAAVIYIK